MPELTTSTNQFKLSGNVTPEEKEKFIENIKKALDQDGHIEVACIIITITGD